MNQTKGQKLMRFLYSHNSFLIFVFVGIGVWVFVNALGYQVLIPIFLLALISYLGNRFTKEDTKLKKVFEGFSSILIMVFVIGTGVFLGIPRGLAYLLFFFVVLFINSYDFTK
jgi:predicted Na+-dependent transporter